MMMMIDNDGNDDVDVLYNLWKFKIRQRWTLTVVNFSM